MTYKNSFFILIILLVVMMVNSCESENNDSLSNTVINGNIGTLTDIDNNTYKIVKIGDQWWMAENLKVTHYSDGSEIKLITNNEEWKAIQYTNNIKAYCFYENDSSMLMKYGNLYNWMAATNNITENKTYIQGVCPNGWHLPSDEEWHILTLYLGIDSAGGKIKETGTINWSKPNDYATNESGFTALPGGFRGINYGSFERESYNAYWWTSSELDNDNAWLRGIGYLNKNIYVGNSPKAFGNSVRCVKNL
ncbi:fibrobacter succinogenes major paralogous domain-containing protein [Saccharicrinis sp. FJH2]|uniref:fibrobacter succinogenes major paralogous domain-containing protein n=1 Tax=Saccharicrinis sp. FJH65 TaxID=3344659 RepID=UPI0035F3233D